MTPEKIHAAQLQAISYHQHLTDLRFKQKQLEADITLEACGQMRPDGKPILSNDLVRQAAITKLKGEREDYVRLMGEVREAEAQLWRAQAQLELQRGLFQIRNEPTYAVVDGSTISRDMGHEDLPVCIYCEQVSRRHGSLYCSDVCEASFRERNPHLLECPF